MKILRKLTWSLIPLLILVSSAGGWLFFQENPRESWQNLTQKLWSKGLKENPQHLLKKEDTAEIARQIEQGNMLVSRARQQLVRANQGWTAEVLQLIQTPEQTFRGVGRYVQATNGKSRLELNMEISGVSGRLLQISNGHVVWQIDECKMPATGKTDQPEALPDYDLQIQRVDLQRILQFAETAGLDPDRPEVARETLGGLAGLLASLEAEMDFRVTKKVLLQQEPFLVLEGNWKRPLQERAYEARHVAQSMLQNAPDRVHLYLRERDLLPVRYICLKQKDTKGWYAPLALELSQIVPSTVIDASLFHYLSPDDHLANDVTHESIRRLETRLAIKTAAEAMQGETAPQKN